MLWVVRHAEAEARVVGGPTEYERPLTERGRAQAAALVHELARTEVTAVVSSPYRRAIDTVTPTALVLGLEVVRDDEVREWDDGLDAVADWRAVDERCWRDPDHRNGIGETHRELSVRASTALRARLAQSGSGTMIVASHGTWIARGLEGLGVRIPSTLWTTMPNPAIYVVSEVDGKVTATGPGLPG
jgi:2,3-bisphosphoglycerate-dependent phosphoglycerate mutase